MVLLVCIQKIRPGKMEELLKEVTPKFRAAHERLGFPPQKMYRSGIGSHDVDTVISAMEWESMAAMESAYNQFFADPEAQELNERSLGYIESTRWELYWGVE